MLDKKKSSEVSFRGFPQFSVPALSTLELFGVLNKEADSLT